ncbi:right-handed parallel beta-helix repeat-containing protein [candidate division KSB1 bacterium]|nr:right-handed parallel beta-helix repeat-containing protein [candidate division KSB1 bacterium]
MKTGKKQYCTMMLLFVLMMAYAVTAQNYLNNPESVVYDADRDRYLVSNTGDGKIIAISATGQQSIYASDQESIRGLYIFADKLYAAANAGVIEYDLATGSKLQTLPLAGQTFLNDITSDQSGILYISDTVAGKIFKLNPPFQSSAVFVSGLSSPNGVWFDPVNVRLLVCHYIANSPITAVKLSDASQSTVVNTLFSKLDGITEDNEGRIYISSEGSNSVYRYDKNFTQPPELVSSGHQAPADIFYNKHQYVLAVPNFIGNTVEFIQMEQPPVTKQLVVTNTRDSGPGSLRQAILDAMVEADIDTITFNIPKSDSAYDVVEGVWTIRPQSQLPELNNGPVFIDGTSQSQNQGKTNSDGVEIVINGSLISGTCFHITSGKNRIKGFAINGFDAAIMITGTGGSGNYIYQNYLGTNADATAAVPNLTGVEIKWGARFNKIGFDRKGNVISGNNYAGVLLMSSDTHNNTIYCNFIGTDRTGKNPIPNAYAGIMILQGSNNNIIGGKSVGEGNLISATSSSYEPSYYGCGILIKDGMYNSMYANVIGLNSTYSDVLANGLHGICIVGGEHNRIGNNEIGQQNIIGGNSAAGICIRRSSHNTISGNFIGTDGSSTAQLGNNKSGIILEHGSSNNTIGPGNIIAFNGGDGVRVQHDSTLNNTITENSITKNNGKGIHTLEGGNRELTPPTLLEVTTAKVTGTTYPNSTVEIFADQEDEGGIFQYRITSRTSGNFLIAKTILGPYVTVTVTDSAGNTSEFSNSLPTGVEREERPMVATTWQLSQNYPNPFNQGTMISYLLAAPAHVQVRIFNLTGEEVMVLVNEQQDAGTHAVPWRGEDRRGRLLPSGVYLYRLQVGNRMEVKKLLLTR